MILVTWILSEKRALAQKAEADFFALLRECGIAQDGAVWKDVSGRLVYPSKCSHVTLPSGQANNI